MTSPRESQNRRPGPDRLDLPSEPMLISSTRIVQPQAMMLAIFSLIILSVITLALVIFALIFLSAMAALIAMSPFVAAARSPL